MGSSDHGWLADVIARLPLDCATATSTAAGVDDRVAKLSQKRLVDMAESFATGRSLETPFPLPNVLLIPLAVISQLIQYKAFLRQRGLECHGREDVCASCQDGLETLGLCTGLLSAYAVASAHDPAQLRASGSAAVRLGMLIGLAVDTQDAVASSGPWVSLSTVWGSSNGPGELRRILECYPEVRTFQHTGGLTGATR